MKFGTIVGVYPTDDYGNIVPNMHPSQIQLYAFIFSTDKYPVLKKLNQDWGLADHDIACTCKEPKFQKWDITPCPEAIYRKDPAFAQQILEKANEAFNNIKKFLPRAIPETDIRVKLGQIAPQVNPTVNPFRPQAPAIAPQVGTAPQMMYQPQMAPQSAQPQVQSQMQPQANPMNQFVTPPTPVVAQPQAQAAQPSAPQTATPVVQAQVVPASQAPTENDFSDFVAVQS